MLLPIVFSLLCILSPATEVDLTQLAPEAASAILSQQSSTTNAGEWQVLGMLYHAHALEEAAIESYKRAAKLKAMPKTNYLLGVALARVGQYEEAINSVSTISSYLPAIWQQGYWHLDLGNFDRANAMFTSAIKTDKNCVAAIVGLARVHHATNNSRKTIELLDDIIARGGNHPYVTFLLGSAHRRAGNHQLAAKLLSVSVNGPPRWEDPWVTDMLTYTKGYAADIARAMQAIDEGNLSKAQKKLESLAKRYPKDPAVFNNLATVLLKLGQLTQAQEILKKSMRWSPTYAPSQLTMAFIMQAMGKVDLAIAYANKAIEYQPAMSAAHAFVGRLSFQKGDLPKATTHFTRAIELGNSDPSIREMHGMVLLNVGRVNDALHQFNLVLQISPDRTNCISGKSIATALLGKSDEALQLLAKAKVKYPNDPNIARAWQSVLKIRERK